MEIHCTGCGKLMLACASCQEKVCVFVDKAKPNLPGIYCCRSCRIAFAQEDLGFGLTIHWSGTNTLESIKISRCNSKLPLA